MRKAFIKLTWVPVWALSWMAYPFLSKVHPFRHLRSYDLSLAGWASKGTPLAHVYSLAMGFGTLVMVLSIGKLRGWW